MANLALNISPESSFQPQSIKEFFLARQPILNRDQELYAYELLFRSAAVGSADVTDDVAATASVITHAASLGLDNVIGTSLAFINVDAAVLLSDFVFCLPKQKVMLEILETVKATDRLISRVEELVAAGFVFALDDVAADTEEVQRLLPLVEVIKVDLCQIDDQELECLSKRFKQAGKTLLAEKVENLEQFERCLELGFDLFQGYYFAKPLIMKGKALSASQMDLMRLMAQIICDSDLEEIEQCIEQNPSLGPTLLKLVNPPGAARRVDSISQALISIGPDQLRRWLHILLYAELGRTRRNVAPLLTLATTRSRLLELMAQKMRPDDQGMANLAFTIGILSLMEALIELPMHDILDQLQVGAEIRNALLTRSGVYGDMLSLVEGIEQMQETSALLPLLRKLGISGEKLYALQLEAFEWSDTISHNAA